MFFFSAISWAEVVLTEDEWAELNQILTELQTINSEQRTELQALGRELRTAQSGLKIAKNELIGSQLAIAEAQRLSKEAEQSYKQQRIVVIVSAIVAGLGASILSFTFGAFYAN